MPSSSQSRGVRAARAGWARLLVAVLVVLGLGGTAPYFGRMMNANERPRVLQAIAWVDDAELAVDGPAARGIDPGIDVARSPVDGRLYPNKPPGATLPAVMAYGVLELVEAAGGPTPTLRSVTIVARVFGGVIPTLLLLLTLARRLRRQSYGAAGELTVLVLAFATPLTSYARLLFGHSLCACLLALGTWRLLDASAPDRSSARGALYGGVVAASAVTVEYLAAFAGIPIAILLIVRWRQGLPMRVVGAALGGALIPIAMLAAYHMVVFGSPVSTGYHHVVDTGFAQTHAQGLLGLSLPTASSIFEHLLSPWGGLLVWAPALVVGSAVAIARWRLLSFEARWGSAVWLGFVLLTLGLAQSGGWRVGPRYLVLAMPFAAYGVAELASAIVRRWWWAAMGLGLIVASIVLNASAANLFPHLIPHGNPWAQLLLPLLDAGLVPHAVVPGNVGLWVLAFVCPLIAVATVATRCVESTAITPRQRAGVLVLTVAGAALVLFGLYRLPHDPAASEDANTVQQIWEPNGPRPAPHRVLHSLSR